MTKSATVNFEIEPEAKEMLEKLTSTTDQSESSIINGAIATYYGYLQYQTEEIKRGLREVAEGKVIPHEKLREKWVKRLAKIQG